MTQHKIYTATEAKMLWYSLNPRNQTDLHSENDTLRALAAAHLAGFSTALRVTGHLEVRQ